jgi:signal transduction histidine kinase/CheY-like chemotaxis protein
VNAIPVFNEAHEIIQVIINFIDISESKHTQEELQRYREHLEDTVHERTEELRLARDAAEAANKAKSVFLANMSHELRTPLNAILGFSQLMRRDSDLSSSQRQTLDVINSSGEHLLKLINDVLKIAKIEAGKLQLEITPFDLYALVREVTEMMRLRAQQKGVQLELNQSPELPRYIKGDEARLRQILVNLVSNAVKFTEKGSITIHLGVKDDVQRLLLIEVEDSGTGISEAEQQLLFKPFEQLSASTSRGGTGLGLAIVRQFVQLMGGSITVESTPGKGSLFSVAFPLQEADETEVACLGNMNYGDVTGLAPGQPAYRILIAEDQRDNRLLLAKLMTDLGLEVEVAADGSECIAIFKKWKPDLIWMDRRMPVMDGVETTRCIRQLPGGDMVKIVAVTASAFREQQAELSATGIDDYVTKPYRLNEIYDSLAQQLGLIYTYRVDTSQTSFPDVLEPRLLAELSETQRNELRTALESLDRERIYTVIKLIAATNTALGHKLTHFVDIFDYPSILNALNAVASD